MFQKILLALAFIILINCNAKGQDQIINARNANFSMTNQTGTDGLIPWSTLSNQTYILTPLSPDYGFCVSVTNNNPTNAHTFSVAAFQTGNNNVVDYSNNTGKYAALAIVGNPSPVPVSSTNVFFVRSNGASKVAFKFTGGATLAGVPDTVDIYVVQTSASGCGTVNPQTGQQYTLATPDSGTSATPPVQAVSDGLGQAFWSTSNTVNPATGVLLQHVNANNGTKSLFLDKIIISSTVNVAILIQGTTGLGTTCTTQTIGNQKITNSTTSTGFANFACTGLPVTGLSGAYVVNVAANTTFVLDARGFILPKGTLAGLEMLNIGVVVGTVTSTFSWYEK